MNKKIIAALVGTVVHFIAGFLLYGLLLMKTMQSNAMAGAYKSTEQMGTSGFILILISSFLFCYLLSHIFSAWANITTLAGGASAGALIGFLVFTSFDCGMYASTNIMNSTGLIIDVIASTVLSALAGGAIGWWLGRGK